MKNVIKETLVVTILTLTLATTATAQKSAQFGVVTCSGGLLEEPSNKWDAYATSGIFRVPPKFKYGSHDYAVKNQFEYRIKERWHDFNGHGGCHFVVYNNASQAERAVMSNLDHSRKVFDFYEYFRRWSPRWGRVFNG
jgi:hypothetical protein